VRETRISFGLVIGTNSIKKIILTAAIAAAIGLPSIAIAQTAPVTGAIDCRPAKDNETATDDSKHARCVPHATRTANHRLSPTKRRSSDTQVPQLFCAFTESRGHFVGGLPRGEINFGNRQPLAR
jgi:hypothetical protein